MLARIFGILTVLAALGVLLGACIEGRKREDPETTKAAAKVPYLTEKRLNNIGFKLHWETVLQDRIIRNAWLLADPGMLEKAALYVETESHLLYKIRLQDGFVRWVHDVGGPIYGAPYVYHYTPDPAMRRYDEIYVLTGDIIQAIDEEEGFQLWQRTLNFASSSPPSASGSHVIVGSWKDWVHSISKEEGHLEEWNYKTFGDVTAAGVGKDHLVYVPSNDGMLYCFTAAKRAEPIWKFKTNGPIVAPPYLYRSILYLPSMDFNCYAVSAITGELAWVFRSGNRVMQTPVAIKNSVYVFCKDFGMYAVDRKGKNAGNERWSFRNGTQVLARGKKFIYVLSERGKDKDICAIDDVRGDVLWKHPYPHVDFFLCNPNPDDPTIYLGFRSGWFFAIKEQDEFFQ
ncbi:MAG: outer membrane protein assembly factor BamB family protein [Planctomycetota bacterium]|jgi:hypothetical protein